jgi:arsenate reductase
VTTETGQQWEIKNWKMARCALVQTSKVSRRFNEVFLGKYTFVPPQPNNTAPSLLPRPGFPSDIDLKTMKMITIFHNPRCSKSCEAFGLLEAFATQHGLSVNVIEYLKTPPTPAELAQLHRQIGGDLRQMVRANEEEYASLELDQANDDALLDAIHAHPKLLQRPIVVYRGQAIVARPPELLHDFLKG